MKVLCGKYKQQNQTSNWNQNEEIFQKLKWNNWEKLVNVENNAITNVTCDCLKE